MGISETAVVELLVREKAKLENIVTPPSQPPQGRSSRNRWTLPAWPEAKPQRSLHINCPEKE